MADTSTYADGDICEASEAGECEPDESGVGEADIGDDCDEGSGGRRKTSDVWQHFTKLDSVFASCHLCKKKFSYKTTISNLRKHLRKKHSILEIAAVNIKLDADAKEDCDDYEKITIEHVNGVDEDKFSAPYKETRSLKYSRKHHESSLGSNDFYDKLDKSGTIKKFHECLDKWSLSMAERDDEVVTVSKAIAMSLKGIKHRKKRKRAQAEIFTVLANYASSDSE